MTVACDPKFVCDPFVSSFYGSYGYSLKIFEAVKFVCKSSLWNFLFLGALGLCCRTLAFFSCGAQASHCSGFLCLVMHRFTCSSAYGIFLDQESNPCALHWQVDSYPVYHQGSPGKHFLVEIMACVCWVGWIQLYHHLMHNLYVLCLKIQSRGGLQQHEPGADGVIHTAVKRWVRYRRSLLGASGLQVCDEWTWEPSCQAQPKSLRWGCRHPTPERLTSAQPKVQSGLDLPLSWICPFSTLSGWTPLLPLMTTDCPKDWVSRCTGGTCVPSPLESLKKNKKH